MYNSDTRSAVFVVSVAVALMVTVPFIAFAQAEIAAPESVVPAIASEAPAPTPEPAPAPEPASNASTQSEGATEQTTETVQETATSTQETAGGDVLGDTANPEDGATESETIPLDTGTTTDAIEPEIIPIVEAAHDLAPDEIPVAAQTDLTVVEAGIKEAELPALTNAELNALIEPDFVMQISGKKIPTNRKLGDTESVTTSVDPVEGVLTVAGSCSDVYYVVLLYKNQTDYEQDPRSFIVNRAFPCVNGSYTYALADVPVNIQNGTYYLLIGEQGEKGSWRPVTELQEVSINRTN